MVFRVDTLALIIYPGLWRATLVKRLRIQGLIVFDHWDLRSPPFWKR